jgi:hypothetical protein
VKTLQPYKGYIRIRHNYQVPSVAPEAEPASPELHVRSLPNAFVVDRIGRRFTYEHLILWIIVFGGKDSKRRARGIISIASIILVTY